MALRYFRVSALHPISQMIISLTHTLLMPFNQLCALLKLNMRRYDWACFMLIVMTELIKFFLMGLLFLNAMLPGWTHCRALQSLILCADCSHHYELDQSRITATAGLLGLLGDWAHPFTPSSSITRFRRIWLFTFDCYCCHQSYHAVHHRLIAITAYLVILRRLRLLLRRIILYDTSLSWMTCFSWVFMLCMQYPQWMVVTILKRAH